MSQVSLNSVNNGTRRHFIGGSDARVIMGDDEAALLRLWREKRGEIEPEDLSCNLIVQLGIATEKLNHRWYQANTGRVITDVQQWARHPTIRWMAATLDGRVEGGAVFEAKFMLPWQFSEEAAVEKHTHVGRCGEECGSLGDHRRWQVGRNQNLCGSSLPASDRYGRAEILALRRKWRATAPVWRRAAEAAHRGAAHR
jgi:YqaJ-like viral recombinase domain